MAKICPICGHDNPEAVDFCEDCGTDLKISAAPTILQDQTIGTTSADSLPDLEVPAPVTPAPIIGAGDGSISPLGEATPPGAEAYSPSASDPTTPVPPAAGPFMALPAAPAPPMPATQPMVAQTAIPGQPLARLQVRRHGALSGDELPVDGDRVVLGRFDQETGPVDIDLSSMPESHYVSRRHAELYRNPDGQWFIQDLGSSNGVFVRGKDTSTFGSRLSEPRALQDGDEIALGNLRLVFRTS